MSRLLRVLQVEDSESDAALALRILEQGGYEVQSERVETAQQMRAALLGPEQQWDIVIADYRLPQFDAPAALRILQETGRDIPFIVVSGTIGEDLAVRMMKAGAHDYLMKDNLARLAPAVEREIGEAGSRHARHQAEEKLRESSERLTLALAAARMGVWEWDLVTNSLYWSPECFDILKMSTDFSGTVESFASVVHPDDVERVMEAANRAIAERSDFSAEFRVFRKDGKLCWVSNLGQARYGEDGQPLRLTGIVQDITERKQAEDALYRSQAMLDSVVASALDAVIVMDAGGRVVLWNRAAEKMFGYDAAEAVGRELHDLIVPAHLYATYRKGFQTFLESGEGPMLRRVVEMTAVRKDGHEFPVEIGISPLRTSGSTQAVGVVRDITERKIAEAALRESEHRWQFALEGSGDGVWDWRAETNRTYYSRQWKAMLDYQEDEISDRPAEFEERIHPDDRERIRLALERNGAGETPGYAEEYRVRSKNGAYKWVLGRGRVVSRSPHGSPLRIIGTHTDLTELKAAEAEREKLRAQFLQSQKMESIGRLAGGVAHDFNNLLTVINGYSSLLLARMTRDDTMRESIEQIQHAGERATALVRQLLAFSRKEAPVREVLDLNQIVENMGKTAFRLVGEDIRIATVLTPSLPAAMADRNQMEQVLMNLVVNARDAMPDGGTLTVETSFGWLEGPCALCQAGIAPGTYVSVTVRDTGSGIDDNTRQHLFEPFFTTKAVGQGTGLGLSVVHGIVTENGGHLSVESQPGKGTEFRVHFPAVEPKKAVEKAASEPALRGTEALLLVEDETEVRRYLVHALEGYGYRLYQASGGDEALAVLKSEPVDLLITDIVMPRIGGRELARKARLLRPETLVLFMSGYSGDRFGDNPGGGVGEAFLQKPFLPRDLASKVREVLDSRSPLARILVVDDEPGIRSFLRSVLERAGYTVQEAADGRLALASLARWKPDLVITDLVMPEQEGLETIRTLHRDHPSVRILAISGASGGRYLAAAEQFGAHAVLPKPVSPDTLLREVRNVLKG